MYMSHDQLTGPKRTEGESRSDNIIIGNSSAASNLRQMTALAAAADHPLLLTGPAGCGKKVAARAVHAASPQRNNRFIMVNSAALTEENAGQQLFGTAAGRYREADRPPSFLEQARGGTLFFDEIADLPLELQAILSQLLHNGSVPGVPAHHLQGGKSDRGDPHPGHVRIIAASSRCLASMIGENRFRQDLFYHLSLLSIPVPTLRQRREDIPALIDYFMMDKPMAQRFVPDLAAIQLLEAYHWPGNVRELRHLVARACLFHPGQPVGATRMTALLNMGRPSRAVAQSAAPQCDLIGIGPGFNLKAYLDEEELRFIQSALSQARGVVQRAADLSGIKRTTFIEKMKRHGIDRSNFTK